LTETARQRKLWPVFASNGPRKNGRLRRRIEESLLENQIPVGSRLVLAAKAKLGHLVVVRFDERRIGHSVDRRNYDQGAKQVGQKWLENRFEHSALIVAQRHLLFVMGQQGEQGRRTYDHC